jgi:transketolase
MQLNRARVLSTGDDITLISTGICTEEAMRATKVIRSRGISIQHLHVTTVKPFSDPIVLDALTKNKYGVLTMENHTVLGGVGTATAEMMAEHGIGKKLVKIGLQDTFIHGASKPYLMREYGLDAIALVEQIEKLLGIKLNITESDLAEVRLAAVHSEAKAEAL